VAKMGLGNFLGLLGTGKIKPLAVAAAHRSVLVPEIPTLAEAGIDFPPFGWWGLAAPRGVPQPIVDRLNTEFVTLYRGAKCVESPQQPAVPRAREPRPIFPNFTRAHRGGADFYIKISNQRRED